MENFDPNSSGQSPDSQLSRTALELPLIRDSMSVISLMSGINQKREVRNFQTPCRTGSSDENLCEAQEEKTTLVLQDAQVTPLERRLPV